MDFKKSKSFLFPGLILVLVILVSLFWLRPKVMAIIKNSRDLVANRKTLAELTKKMTSLEGLSKPELTDKVDLVLKVLPSEKNVPGNLFVLKKLALDNELMVSELSIPEVGEIASSSAETQKTSKDEILPSLEVRLTLVGSREKIVNFLQQVKSTAPLMRVSGLAISQKEEDLDEAMIDIRTYFLLFPKTIGKLEQSISSITPQEEKVFNELSNFKLFEVNEVSSSSALPTGKSDLFSY